MADIEAGINSTANPRASMPSAPDHQQVECGPHFLDAAFVTEGSTELGIAAGRRLNVMRWHNTTKAVLRAGHLGEKEELYVLVRALGGFIWVPKTGTPDLSTLLNQVVGRGGARVIYRNAAGRTPTNPGASVSRIGAGVGSKPLPTRPYADPYELWAVPLAMHTHRGVAPGEGAIVVHQLFPVQDAEEAATDV